MPMTLSFFAQNGEDIGSLLVLTKSKRLYQESEIYQ